MEKNYIQAPRLTSTPRAGRNTVTLLNNFIEVSPIFPNHSDVAKKAKSMIPVLKTNENRSNGVRRFTVSNAKVSTSSNASGHASSGSGKMSSLNQKSVAEKKNILQARSGSGKMPSQIQKPVDEKKGDIKNVLAGTQKSSENASQILNKNSELMDPEKGKATTLNQKEDCILKSSDKLLGGWLIPKETKNRVSLKRKSNVLLTVTQRKKRPVTDCQQSEESLFDSPELPNLVEVSSLCKKRQTYVLKKKPEMTDIDEEQRESVTDGIIPLQFLSQEDRLSNTSAKNTIDESVKKKEITKTRLTTTIKLSEQPGHKDELKEVNDSKENVEQGSSVSSIRTKKETEETKTRKTIKLGEQPDPKDKLKEINEVKENCVQGSSVSPALTKKKMQESKVKKTIRLSQQTKLREMDQSKENVDQINSASATDERVLEPKAKRFIKLSENAQTEIKLKEINEGIGNVEQGNSVSPTGNEKKIQGTKTRKRMKLEINEDKENNEQGSVSPNDKENKKTKQLTRKRQPQAKGNGNIEPATFSNGITEETKRIMPKRGRKPNIKYNDTSEINCNVSKEISNKNKRKPVKSNKEEEEYRCELSKSQKADTGNKKDSGNSVSNPLHLQDDNIENSVNNGKKTSKKTKTTKSKKNIEMEECAISASASKVKSLGKTTRKSNKAKTENKKTSIKDVAKLEIPAEIKEEPVFLRNNLDEERCRPQNEQSHDIQNNLAVSLTLNAESRSQFKKLASPVKNEANKVSEPNIETHKSGSLSGEDNLKSASHETGVISKPSNTNKKGPEIKNRSKAARNNSTKQHADDRDPQVSSTQRETENHSPEQRCGRVTNTFVGENDEIRIPIIPGNSNSKSESVIMPRNAETSERLKDETENSDSSAEKKRKQDYMNCGASHSGPEAAAKKPRREEFNSEKTNDAGRSYNIRDLFSDNARMKEVQPGVMSCSSIHILNFFMSGEVHIEPEATLTKISTNTAYRVLEGSAEVKISKQTKLISATDKHPRFFIPKGINVSITNVEDVPLKMEFMKFRG